MRNKIWTELTDAKFTQIYAEKTCQFYKRISNGVSILTILFSSGGAIMGLAFWKDGKIFPVVACILTAAVQSIKLIIPKLFPSVKDYKKLDDVVAFYNKKYNELHKLWLEFENKEIEEKDARSIYFKIQAKDNTILHIVNDVLTDDNRRRKRSSREDTVIFISNHF